MLWKPTDDLMEELTRSENLDQYIKKNEAYFIDTSLAEALNQKLKEKGLAKSAVIKAAEINEIYGYQIFSGKRIPSREKLLCILIGMKLSLPEVQQLLKLAMYAPLYPKNIRDSIIISGLQHSKTVIEINELLYDHQEPTLD